MKRKFEELRENLDEFVDQVDYPVLIVGCLPDELAYVLKFLQGLDQQYPQNLFVMFAHPFLSASAYLNGAIESLRVQLAAANDMRAERGEPAYPELPPELVDPRGPVEQRLQGLLFYLKGLLPNETEHLVVVGLLPLECPNVDQYAKLVASILPVPTMPEWMGPLRIVAYDDRANRRLGPLLQRHAVDTVLTFDVDFSTPALTDSLARDAADTSLPVAERMSCLMQLAALDYSYKRYPEALQKYSALHQYYSDLQVPSMQALCLLGAGDTLRAGGRPLEGKTLMQSGVVLCMEHKVLPPLLNLLVSLVEVSFDLRQYADAESYADSGAQVASGLLNGFARADLLEKKGDAALEQRKLKEATTSYQESRELSEKLAHLTRWKSVLTKLVSIHGQANRYKEQRDAEQELARVEELQPRESSGMKPPAERGAGAL